MIFGENQRSDHITIIIKKLKTASLRPAQTKKHSWGSKSASRTQKCFWKISEAFFCFEDADFVSSTYITWGSKRGITWETLKKYCLWMCPACFLVCVPKQHILKKQNLRLGSKNVLLLSLLRTHTTLSATLTQNV